MKRLNVLGCIVGVALAVIISFPHAAAAIWLNVPTKFQEKSNWCWSATSQAVLEYYGIYYLQTEIAAYGTPGQDNLPNYLYGQDARRKGLDMILAYFGGIYSQGVPYPVSENQVVYSIENLQRPMPIRWGWESIETGHIAALTGVAYQEQVLYVSLMDPARGRYIKTYDWVDGGSPDGSWTHTLVLQRLGPVSDEGVNIDIAGINPYAGVAPKVDLPAMLPNSPNWDGAYLSKP